MEATVGGMVNMVGMALVKDLALVPGRCSTPEAEVDRRPRSSAFLSSVASFPGAGQRG